jgi:hypothetical protein
MVGSGWYRGRKMVLLVCLIGSNNVPCISGAGNETAIANATSVANVIIRAPSVDAVGTLFLETTLPETMNVLTCGWGVDGSGNPLVPPPQSRQALNECAIELGTMTTAVEDPTANVLLDDGTLNVELQIGMAGKVSSRQHTANFILFEGSIFGHGW